MYYTYLYPRIIYSLFKMYALKKRNASPFCILCMQLPQIIPLSTLTEFIKCMKSPSPGSFCNQGLSTQKVTWHTCCYTTSHEGHTSQHHTSNSNVTVKAHGQLDSKMYCKLPSRSQNDYPTFWIFLSQNDCLHYLLG